MNILKLDGCTPEPLMSYLKALGVFRLVVEQKDPAARLSWLNGVACLHTQLTRETLVSFFLEEYRPTPILAPWNGGSGFYEGSIEPLEEIEVSSSHRLELYRKVIATIKQFVPKAKPKDDDKNQLLIDCRAKLPDEVVPWLDVCFVLDEEGQTFFPLLGTGGNDGRLDFTNNFMQRLAEVINLVEGSPVREHSRAWLEAGLFNDVLVSLSKVAIGQFNPGGIGGPNGRQGDFEADSRVNAWDYVLMLEGAILFAGSVARRFMGKSSSKAIFPFTVSSVAVGYGSATASEETIDGSRAELWLPLWKLACTLSEVQHLFAEGRAQLNRRQASNAVEFALAANLLGVHRGIDSFARYAFLKRNGLAFLAAPLGRVQVQLRPTARLLDDPPLIQWIDQWRRACRDKDKTPSRYQVVLRNIDRAMFAFTNRSEQGNDAPYLINVLRAIGQAEQTLANGLRFAKENRLRPLSGLNEQWLTEANDGSPEFRLAAAIAGIERTKHLPAIRCYLEEVESTNFVSWQPGSTSAMWSKRSVTENLMAIFRRRLLENFQQGGVGMPLYSQIYAPLVDVLSFLRDETDDQKFADLLWGLVTVKYHAQHQSRPSVEWVNEAIPIEFSVLRLLVSQLRLSPNAYEGAWSVTPEQGLYTTADADVFHVLASGRRNAVAEAVTRGAKRLKSSGFLVNGYRNRQHTGRDIAVTTSSEPARLIAAMLVPLSNIELTRIASAVLYPSESKDLKC